MSRTATRSRTTSESEITVTLDLDGTGLSRISTGVGFYDHMLTALSRHSLIDLDIQASGDVHIDGHHVVEDTAIVLGQALGEALGDKRGIRRYADATVPLDEALAHCVVAVAGRPYPGPMNPRARRFIVSGVLVGLVLLVALSALLR